MSARPVCLSVVEQAKANVSWVLPPDLNDQAVGDLLMTGVRKPLCRCPVCVIPAAWVRQV